MDTMASDVEFSRFIWRSDEEMHEDLEWKTDGELAIKYARDQLRDEGCVNIGILTRAFARLRANLADAR